MSKSIIVGDVHLGKGTNIGKNVVGSMVNSRIEDQFKILNWIYDTAIKNDVHNLIFTGDIFQDTKPDIAVLLLIVEWLKKCSNNNIKCHLIVGNHDLRRTGTNNTSVLDLINGIDFPNIFVYKNLQSLNIGDNFYTFMPFIDRKMMGTSMPEAIEVLRRQIKEEATKAKDVKKKILIGHMAIDGSMYSDEIDELSNEIMCPSDMFFDYDYSIFGHVHKPQVMNEKPYVSHIGSMDISDFGETEQEKIIILIDNKLKGGFKEIPVPSRTLKRIRETIPKDEDPTKYIINLLKKNKDFSDSIVKLEISFEDSTAAELDRNKVSELLSTLGVFNIAGFTETRNKLAVNKEKENVESDISPKAAVKVWAESIDDEDVKEQLINFCNEIIEEIEAK
jgi:DNA repair exonuclease SbcCD nuclease subunit